MSRSRGRPRKKFGSGKHTRFGDKAKRKYVKSGKYVGYHRMRLFKKLPFGGM